MSRRRRHLAAATLAAVLGVAAGAAAQAPRRLPPLENVRLLKGWDGAQVREEMRRISEALGVKCDHCHVQGNFASDEKRPKQTARRMLELTMTLNGASFASHTPAEGESRLGRVTCYTCHRGAEIPKSGAGMGPVR
ncbi:MAG: c-type cytochrome [Vicinamibacterales bacterium]